MSLWVDKYRPTALEKLDYHENLTKKLSQMVCLSFNHRHRQAISLTYSFMAQAA
jgi:hypothetical protein